MLWSAHDLENKLADFQAYYNEHRTHSSRDDDTPGGSTVYLSSTLTDFA
jgi:transposase InsO family protein